MARTNSTAKGRQPSLSVVSRLMRTVGEFARAVGRDWPAISKARDASAGLLEELRAKTSFISSEDLSLVVFGSAARRELTGGSDLDWTLLVDGLATPEHHDAFSSLQRVLSAVAIGAPGREGTFGSLSFSHDLIHYIGGEDDTNANTTLRLLLLLESLPVGRCEAHQRTVRNVLRRYILEDFVWLGGDREFSIPRFLHNDIVRYWRTITVDFAYKRKTRDGSGWALRTAKLRISRKLLYAAGLLVAYSCALSPALRGIGRGENSLEAAQPIIEHLESFVEQPALDTLVRVLAPVESLQTSLTDMLDVYDAFLQLLDDEEKRNALNLLGREDIAGAPVYQEIRALGDRFQEALSTIFVDCEPFASLTRKYGVF